MMPPLRMIGAVALAFITTIAIAGDALALDGRPASRASLFPGTDNLGIQDRPVLLAQKKKSKKKSKKKKSPSESDSFGDGLPEADDSDAGVGVHREQEGVDVPYKAEVSLATDLSFMTIETEGSESDPVSATTIDLAVEWLFIVGSFEVGPDFAYRSETSAMTTTTTDPTTKKTTTSTVETEYSTYSVGGLFKWNFADIDHADLVPFAYGGLGIRASEAKTEGVEKSRKSSGTVIRAGGGLNIFLDSNIAFNPRAEFRMETDKDDDAEEAAETTTSGFKILVGIAVFI